MNTLRQLTSKPLVLLSRQSRSPRKPKAILQVTTLQDIQALLPSDDSILALDLETRGADFSDPESRIVGIGFSDRNGCFYLDWDGLEPDARDYMFQVLRSRPLTSFNVQFDGGFLWAKAGLGWLNWSMCTFGLFRQLATEGHDDQMWNLETLERDVLGWPTSNKDEMKEALVRNGLTKSDMYKLAKLEPELFGRYCALDAEAHLQGFEVLAEATVELGEHGDTIRTYHAEDFLTEVRLLIEQQLRGITINVPRLTTYSETLNASISAGLEQFLDHPEVKPVVMEYNSVVVAKVLEKEPPKFKKDGTLSVRWEQWLARVEEAKQTTHFNPGSPKQLSWLFYDKLGHSPRKWTDDSRKNPSTDKEVLPFLGEPGRLLSKTKKTQKEQSYVTACLAKQRDGVVHPQCKSVGTVTGRLAGGFDE